LAIADLEHPCSGKCVCGRLTGAGGGGEKEEMGVGSRRNNDAIMKEGAKEAVVIY